MIEFGKEMLMSFGVFFLTRGLAQWFGWWTGIYYGWKGDPRRGWWTWRELPPEKEWRKLGGGA